MRRLVPILALACGLAVANVYYAQPCLDAIAFQLGVGPGAAGLIVTMAQLGFVLGLIVLVPLGDVVSRRNLVSVLLLICALGLAAAANAPSIGVLAAAICVIGLTSVVAQVLVPFAATLASEADRGRVVGAVMTGMMLGTLLSRTLAGAVAGAAGWRAVFWLSAALMVGLAVVLYRCLPQLPPPAVMRYGELLRSVGRLVAREAVLRRRAAYGAATFATFSAFWTTVAFVLARPPYEFGEAAIGLVGLVGLPSAFAAPYAGHLADRGHSRLFTGAYLVATLVGVALALVGAHSLGALLVGGFLIAVSVGCVHVTNQSVIYRLDPAARSRLTTAYMTTYFLGGMAGSACGAALYAAHGWSAVIALGAAFTTAALIGWLVEIRGMLGRRRRAG
jgi:predicted MFS family arabinose efflux permease